MRFRNEISGGDDDHESATLRVALRRTLWQKAMKGDTKLLIWLGKQVLKQTDKREIDHGTTIVVWRLALAAVPLSEDLPIANCPIPSHP